MSTGPRQIFLVVGGKNAGKTAYLQFLIQRAKENGLRVGGILSLAELQHGKKERYILVDLKTGRKRLLAWRDSDPNQPVRIGSYAFDDETLEMGEQILRSSMDCDLILLDEYGPLEQKGGGFRPAVEWLLDHFPGILGISVRPALVTHLKELISSRK